MELRRLENIEELTPEIFSVFRRQPPLLTAGNRENCNTMTIGWCQLGSLVEHPGVHGLRPAGALHLSVYGGEPVLHRLRPAGGGQGGHRLLRD